MTINNDNIYHFLLVSCHDIDKISFGFIRQKKSDRYDYLIINFEKNFQILLSEIQKYSHEINDSKSLTKSVMEAFFHCALMIAKIGIKTQDLSPSKIFDFVDYDFIDRKEYEEKINYLDQFNDLRINDFSHKSNFNGECLFEVSTSEVDQDFFIKDSKKSNPTQKQEQSINIPNREEILDKENERLKEKEFNRKYKPIETYTDFLEFIEQYKKDNPIIKDIFELSSK